MQRAITGKPGNSLQLNYGMALLEVLISSLIVATGILAVLSMQTQALATTQTNRHFLQAEWLLNDMLERMKANPAGFAQSLENTPQGEITVACETSVGCSSTELAAHDLAQWYWRLEALLPAGRGEIALTSLAGFPDAARVYRVLVQWHGSKDDSHIGSIPHSSAIVVL